MAIPKKKSGWRGEGQTRESKALGGGAVCLSC
jgi:hypothetical protein